MTANGGDDLDRGIEEARYRDCIVESARACTETAAVAVELVVVVAAHKDEKDVVELTEGIQFCRSCQRQLQ